MTTAVTEPSPNMESADVKDTSSPATDGKTTEGVASDTSNAANNVDGAGEEKKETTEEATKSPSKTLKKPTVHKTDYEKDVVYLFQFSRSPKVPSVSPFCLKVETFLRMAELQYRNVDHQNKFKSKKGQLPFVEVNGEELADSIIIIRELSQKFNKDLDADLKTEQKIVSHAFESMLDNHTSWVVRYWRFKNPDEYLKTSQTDMKQLVNSKLPKQILNFVYKIGLKNNMKQAIGHGIGRNTMEEVVEFGKNDLRSLSDLLGEQSFFFGENPHLLDCVAFAHLCQFIYTPFCGFKEWMESDTPNLVKFVERMKEKYWPDWDDACSKLDLNSHVPKEELESEEAKKEAEKEAKKAEKEKEKAEKKKKREEEKERKKKEKEEKAAKEKAEKEKAEKEKAEKAEKEKAEKEKAETDEKKAEEEKPKSDKVEPTPAEEKSETKDSDAKAAEVKTESEVKKE